MRGVRTGGGMESGEGSRLERGGDLARSFIPLGARRRVHAARDGGDAHLAELGGVRRGGGGEGHGGGGGGLVGCEKTGDAGSGGGRGGSGSGRDRAARSIDGARKTTFVSSFAAGRTLGDLRARGGVDRLDGDRALGGDLGAADGRLGAEREGGGDRGGHAWGAGEGGGCGCASACVGMTGDLETSSRNSASVASGNTRSDSMAIGGAGSSGGDSGETVRPYVSVEYFFSHGNQCRQNVDANKKGRQQGNPRAADVDEKVIRVGGASSTVFRSLSYPQILARLRRSDAQTLRRSDAQTLGRSGARHSEGRFAFSGGDGPSVGRHHAR